MRRLLFFASIWFTAVPGIAVVHPRALGHTVRGDLTRIQQGIVLAGGADMTTGAATADTFTLTGSGDGDPPRAMRQVADRSFTTLARLTPMRPVCTS
jgi:hypothetical protein